MLLVTKAVRIWKSISIGSVGGKVTVVVDLSNQMKAYTACSRNRGVSVTRSL